MQTNNSVGCGGRSCSFCPQPGSFPQVCGSFFAKELEFSGSAVLKFHPQSILFSLIKNRAANFYTCTSEKTARSHHTLFSRSDCWPKGCNFVGIRYFRGIHAPGRFIIYSVLSA